MRDVRAIAAVQHVLLLGAAGEALCVVEGHQRIDVMIFFSATAAPTSADGMTADCFGAHRGRLAGASLHDWQTSRITDPRPNAAVTAPGSTQALTRPHPHRNTTARS